MSIGRPMNEYEGALFSALMTVTKAIRDLGAGRASLAGEFRVSARNAAKNNHESEAAVLEFLGNLAERDAFYVPTPPFMVIDGGKSDPSN